MDNDMIEKEKVSITEDAYYPGMRDSSWGEKMQQEVTVTPTYGYHYSDAPIESFSPKVTCFFHNPYSPSAFRAITSLYLNYVYCYRITIPKGTEIYTDGNEFRVVITAEMEIIRMEYKGMPSGKKGKPQPVPELITPKTTEVPPKSEPAPIPGLEPPQQAPQSKVSVGTGWFGATETEALQAQREAEAKRTEAKRLKRAQARRVEQPLEMAQVRQRQTKLLQVGGCLVGSALLLYGLYIKFNGSGTNGY